ncbi:hypothetical protein QEN19_000227 [Hanseniaspora menglaensis]
MSDSESVTDKGELNLGFQESDAETKKKQQICDFYAVYFLRSIPKKNSTYIGSSPNPIRRLRQHNGDQKGGAFRTKIKGKQPWEMCLLVHGFPNKSIALKFEHAWQHVYISRFSKKKHSEWKMSKNGNSGFNFKIKALKLLLYSNHFSQFDLKVVIFDNNNSLEIYNIWHKDIKRYNLDPKTDGSCEHDPEIFANNELNGKIKGLFDLSDCLPEELSIFQTANDNMKIITNFYNLILQELIHLKIKTENNEKSNLLCFFCQKTFDSQRISCYFVDCDFSAHFKCAYPFISNININSLLPKKVFDCPRCKNELSWYKIIQTCNL